MAKGKLTPYGIVQKAVMYDPNLTALAKCIYSFLVVHQAHQNDVVFPSLNHIAKTLKMSRTTVVKHIQELENHHWIQKQNISGKSNRYLPLHDFELPVQQVNKSEQGVQEMNNTSTGGEQVLVQEVNTKNTSKKNTKEDSTCETTVSQGVYHKKFVEVFSNFWETKFNTPYVWGSNAGKEMKHMKELRKKIITKISEATPEKINDIDYCAHAFQIFLKNINHKWVLNNLEPSIINSKFNTIYAAIQDKQFKSDEDLSTWVINA